MLHTKAYTLALEHQQIVDGAGSSEAAFLEAGAALLKAEKQVLFLALSRTDGTSIVLNREQVREIPFEKRWYPPAEYSGQGEVVSHPFSSGTAYHLKYALVGADGAINWLHVGLSTAKYNRDLNSLYRRTAAVGLVCLLLSLILSLLFAKRLVNPLLTLKEAIQRAASGDLTVRTRLTTGDEVEQLARCFNEMIRAMNHTHEQLLQAKVTAEEASRVKTRFLANMTHEVRTPMNGIMGTLRLLSGTHLDQSQKRYIATALKSSEALLSLISDILDLSKIEADKMTVERREFILTDTVEHTLRLFQEEAQKKEIYLSCIVEGAIPDRLRGDDLRLGQILMNLLSNALKFTDSGEIVLRVSVTEHVDRDVVVNFSLSDTGVGIGIQEQATVFNRFTQEDSSTTRKFGGSGLGLAICRELTELMGGEIGVRSQKGRGATFSFSLPFEEVPRSDRKGSNIFPGLCQATVVVADPDPYRRARLVEQLQNWKCQVNECNGLTACRSLVLAEPDQPLQALVFAKSEADADELQVCRAVIETALDRGAKLVMLGATPTVIANSLPEGFPVVHLPDPVLPTNLYGAVSGCKPSETFSVPVRPLREHTRISSPREKVRILLAEDHPVNQQITMELLRQWGYECDCASTGREAMEAVSDNRYDLVLMDCQMPEMDGYQATREIRKWEAQQKVGEASQELIPIIALTANTSISDQERCLASGMNHCLSKPLDMDRFKEVVREFFTVEHDMTVEVSRPSETALDQVCDYQLLLERCGSCPDRVQRIVSCFTDQTRQDLERLEQAMESCDPDEVMCAAHRIKGAAANLVVKPLQKAAAELERVARNGKLDSAGELFIVVRREFNRFLDGGPWPQINDTHRTDNQPRAEVS